MEDKTASKAQEGLSPDELDRPVTLRDLKELEDRIAAKMREYVHEDTERLRKIVQDDGYKSIKVVKAKRTLS